MAGPLRRAVRAVPKVAAYLDQLRPIEEIQLDIDAAEAFLCAKLWLPRPEGLRHGDCAAPDLTRPRELLTPDSGPMARLGLTLRLQMALATRVRECTAEYASAVDSGG